MPPCLSPILTPNNWVSGSGHAEGSANQMPMKVAEAKQFQNLVLTCAYQLARILNVY